MDDSDVIACVPGCGACCIEPSISTPIPEANGIPGLPGGKPAGVPCPQLRADFSCGVFGRPERPAVCASLKPTRGMCGHGRQAAFEYLRELERATRSDKDDR